MAPFLSALITSLAAMTAPTSTTSGTSEPLSFTCLSHGVANYDDWLAGFNKNCEPSKDNFYMNELKVKYLAAAKTGDGKTFEIGIYPSSVEDKLREITKFDGPPFVGGDDLIAKKVVTPPFEPNLVGKLVLDRIDDPAPYNPEDLAIYVVQHGVPSFDEWYEKAFGGGALLPPELAEPLGIVRTLVGVGPKRGENETIVLFHYVKKSCLDAMKQFTTYDSPPFVGGLDFIGKGLVIPPFDLNMYSDMVLDHTFTYEGMNDVEKET